MSVSVFIPKDELCPAHCAAGVHNGRDCITCDGTGLKSVTDRIAAEAASKTPACPVSGPPTGIWAGGADTPAGRCEFTGDQRPAGPHAEAI